MTADSTGLAEPLRVTGAEKPLRRIFIRDFALDCLIGVCPREKVFPQRIRINVDLRENQGPLDDDIANAVCYKKVTDGIRSIVARGHVNLVETLAEDIAKMCLADHRVRWARVRVEKLDVLPDVAGVGVEIERFGHAG